MVEIRLRPSAERDFIDIGNYTRDQWSQSQAEAYLQHILRVIGQIGDRPLSGQKADRVAAGYRRRRVGSHLIFYVIAADGAVEVVRILHERTDVDRYLRDV